MMTTDAFSTISLDFLTAVTGGGSTEDAKNQTYAAGQRLAQCLAKKGAGDAWGQQECYDNFINVDMKPVLSAAGVNVSSKDLCTGSFSQSTPAPRPRGCFAAGTRVHTPRGPIAIERLVVSDEVLCHVGNLQTIARVVVARSTNALEIVRVRFADDSSVDVTPQHRFFDVGGRLWHAEDLSEGVVMRNADGSLTRCIAIEQISSNDIHAVYNLALDIAGTFYANGKLVESLASARSQFRARPIASQLPFSMRSVAL
jgi:hypothetical protein